MGNIKQIRGNLKMQCDIILETYFLIAKIIE